MLSKSGVKVLDFGLAKSPGDDTLTGANALVGTPAYVAPEQKEGKAITLIPGARLVPFGIRRVIPPLVITSDQVDWALEGIEATFRQS